MLLSIQFPLADLRHFMSGTGRLQYPSWPLPVPDKEFVRLFGNVKLRKRGGLTGWIGESEICEAKRAFRFSRRFSSISRVHGTNVRLMCAFRRLYVDGWVVGKFEVGVGIKLSHPNDWSNKQTKELLTQILGMPIYIRNPLASHRELIHAGKDIAQLYRYASSLSR